MLIRRNGRRLVVNSRFILAREIERVRAEMGNELEAAFQNWLEQVDELKMELAAAKRELNECARQSWCDPAGASPAQVRSSVRLVASVA